MARQYFIHVALIYVVPFLFFLFIPLFYVHIHPYFIHASVIMADVSLKNIFRFSFLRYSLIHTVFLFTLVVCVFLQLDYIVRIGTNKNWRWINSIMSTSEENTSRSAGWTSSSFFSFPFLFFLSFFFYYIIYCCSSYDGNSSNVSNRRKPRKPIIRWCTYACMYVSACPNPLFVIMINLGKEKIRKKRFAFWWEEETRLTLEFGLLFPLREKRNI